MDLPTVREFELFHKVLAELIQEFENFRTEVNTARDNGTWFWHTGGLDPNTGEWDKGKWV